MSYYVYMLLTERNTIYTGIAKDVNKRFLAHLNGKKSNGAKYTSANKPLKIIFKKEFENKSSALKYEYKIKKLSHNEKLKLSDIAVF